jgi:voltage-gated potassium channel
VGPMPGHHHQRGRLTAFVARHEFIWDLGFGALAVVYLAAGIAADSGSDPSSAVLLFLAAVFLAEFALRLWDAPSRYAYLRGHWIDFVSAIPLVGGLRAVRLLRLLRLGAALRVLSSAEAAARARGGGRHSLWYMGPALVVVWFSSATAYYLLERDVNANVHSFGDALYWSFATATTVGYGAGTPATAGGKVLSGALILVSIGLVGVVSSRLVASWLGADGADHDQRLEARLQHIEEILTSMQAALIRHETRHHGGEQLTPDTSTTDMAGDRLAAPEDASPGA